MIKVKDSIEEQPLNYYYLYVRNLKVLNHIASKPTPDKLKIEEFINQIELYHSKLQGEYLENITERTVSFINESIFNRQKHLFVYLKENFFFDLPQDRKEEIDKILSEELEVNEITSPILEHKSMYNTKPIKETLALYLPKMYRFCYFEHFLFWLRDYFIFYKDTNALIMRDVAFLDPCDKYYIGIMAVSTMKSHYLLKMLEEHFLEEGGDTAWLIGGLSAVPKRLQVLSLLNNIIAHQPWKISNEEIKNLKSYWTLNEIAEIAIIMIHFNKLSIIEQSLNIRKNFFQDTSSFENSLDDLYQENLMKQIEEIEIEEKDELSKEQEQKPRKFDKNSIKQESFQSAGESEQKDEKNKDDVFKKHISSEYQSYIFQGYDKESICTFLEFNWRDDGKYILSNYIPNRIHLLNEEINYITNLCVEQTNPEKKSYSPRDNLLTSPQILSAVSHYIEKLFGYYHEDYNYSNITKLFGKNSPIKKFIKKVACFPFYITTNDIEELNKTFKHEEIMHLIALVAIIKSRVQLIYLTRAINEVIKTIE